mgnify:CR=1 FL=1
MIYLMHLANFIYYSNIWIGMYFFIFTICWSTICLALFFFVSCCYETSSICKLCENVLEKDGKICVTEYGKVHESCYNTNINSRLRSYSCGEIDSCYNWFNVKNWLHWWEFKMEQNIIYLLYIWYVCLK